MVETVLVTLVVGVQVPTAACAVALPSKRAMVQLVKPLALAQRTDPMNKGREEESREKNVIEALIWWLKNMADDGG